MQMIYQGCRLGYRYVNVYGDKCKQGNQYNDLKKSDLIPTRTGL